jgi:cytoskeletal protein CcmA (bactofilin family)
MPYTINFSDPSKTTSVTVPDMPPGINTVDTSLSLVGRGYPNYGQKMAENFVHLLENFASALPPSNPIEGQLWYDTSDPNNKVLRIMDGTASATRWPSANGIYQQGTDPRFSNNLSSAGLKVGDLWVDTANNQVKIYNSNGWTVVGPNFSDGILKNGPIVVPLTDNKNPPNTYNVIQLWSEGNVTAIISGVAFTPRVVIEGFTTLLPGVNLRSDGKFNGTAISAETLTVNGSKYGSERFLRKDDSSTPSVSGQGQIITGRVLWQTPVNQSGSQGRDGIVITNSSTPTGSEYVQFYKNTNDAWILNNTVAGKIYLKVRPNSSPALSNIVVVGSDLVNINTSTRVTGNVSVSETLTVESTMSNSLIVNGGALVNGTLTASQNINVAGNLTVSGSLSVGSTILPSTTEVYDLGSSSKSYNRLYVKSVGTTATTYYGNLVGLATGLRDAVTFRLQGQVTATSFIYSGATVTATFNTSLTPSAFTAQTVVTSATSTASMLILEGGAIASITKGNLLQNIFPTGMITAYGGSWSSSAPSGWLLCDGTSYNQIDYQLLFGIVGTSYAKPGDTGSTTFRVPDMRGSTTATNATIKIAYIIKT